MSAIPFGFVGAIVGHMVMDYTMSIINMFGIIALTGVVVNDSLVLIDAANTYRAEGLLHSRRLSKEPKEDFVPFYLRPSPPFGAGSDDP